MEMKVLYSVVAIMAAGVLSTAQAQVLDQSQEVQDGGISVNNNEHVAQGFVQGAGLPYLAEIWVGDFVGGGDTYPLDITLEIRSGVAVIATGLGLIHTADFALTEAPADGWHKFVYPAPVALVPGNNYTFVLKGTAGNTGTTIMGLNKVDSYGGTGLILSTSANAGATWGAPGGFTYDLRFQTYSRADFSLVLDRATVQDSASLCFTGEVGKVYNLQATTDTVNFQGWEDVGGTTVAGDGGVGYLFDPTEPTGSSTSKTYRIIEN
jgi:hypothetical protein